MKKTGRNCIGGVAILAHFLTVETYQNSHAATPPKLRKRYMFKPKRNICKLNVRKLKETKQGKNS